jgi:membrane protease YdiL (CAAX protease family)
MDYSKYTYFEDMIDYVIMSILLLLLLNLIKKKKILSFDFKNFFKGIIIGLPILIIAFIILVSSYKNGINNGYELLPLHKIVFFIIAMFGTGFTEELLNRGIIQNTMYDAFNKNTYKGIFISILFTSICFGLSHYLNLFTTNMSFIDVTIQVIGALGVGMLFGAIYARCNNLWSVIFIHGFWDLSILAKNGFFGGKGPMFNSTNSGIQLYDLILPIVEILLALIIIRKNKLSKENIIV